MIVAMHGHSNIADPNQFAKPESFAAAMAMSKYFWVNLDIGHFTAAGYDPVAYIKEHHDHISNLHLKDRKKNEGPNVPWDQGDTPIKPVLLLLREAKYPIPASIEYEYRGADGCVAEVKKCFVIARKRWRNNVRSGLTQPILAGKVRDAGELPLIIGHDSVAESSRLSGDEEIVAADRPPGPFEANAKAAINRIGRRFEGQNVKGAEHCLNYRRELR